MGKKLFFLKLPNGFYSGSHWCSTQISLNPFCQHWVSIPQLLNSLLWKAHTCPLPQRTLPWRTTLDPDQRPGSVWEFTPTQDGRMAPGSNWCRNIKAQLSCFQGWQTLCFRVLYAPELPWKVDEPGTSEIMPSVGFLMFLILSSHSPTGFSWEHFLNQPLAQESSPQDLILKILIYDLRYWSNTRYWNYQIHNIKQLCITGSKIWKWYHKEWANDEKLLKMNRHIWKRSKWNF